MKTTFTAALIVLLLCTSCFSTKVTHGEAMDRAVIGQSKDNIINTFGLPDDKKIEGNYEEWIYNKGQKTVTNKASTFTSANVSPSGTGATGTAVTHGGGSVSQTYNNYIKITFKDDRAMKWDSQGVDYSEYGLSAGKTLASIALFVGVFLAVLALG